ncbi:hypothetical protein PIROE2DRAFT_2082 [Piromyces sp. E2]|nr:hypothetical protein PIROE2DRAFT_2082 [Piromyces sp. E2]|eukprot:OUM69891.1 hypothetical protein PIROE2DRAFT_2082 [Piromyces sp. E2]
MKYIIIKFKSNTFGPFRSNNLSLKDVYNIINIPLNGDYEIYKYLSYENKCLTQRRKKFDINTSEFLENGIYVIEEKVVKSDHNFNYSSKNEKNSYDIKKYDNIDETNEDHEKKLLPNSKINSTLSENSSITDRRKTSTSKLNSMLSVQSSISDGKMLQSSKKNSILSINSNISNYNRLNSEPNENSNIKGCKTSLNNKNNSIHSVCSNNFDKKKLSSSKLYIEQNMKSNISEPKNDSIMSVPSSTTNQRKFSSKRSSVNEIRNENYNKNISSDIPHIIEPQNENIKNFYTEEELKGYINKYINLENVKKEIMEKLYQFDNNSTKDNMNDNNDNEDDIEDNDDDISNNNNNNNNSNDNENFDEEKGTDIINEEGFDNAYYKDLGNIYTKNLEELSYSDDESIKQIHNKKRQLKYDAAAYLYYLLNRKKYTNTLLHSVMSNIKNQNNFINENHFLNYIAMKNRIEKRDIKIPHYYNYSSTIHEYFINTDDNYKRKCNNTYDWKIRPTYLFREKINTFLIDYYYRVYNKRRNHHHHHHHYHHRRHHSSNTYNYDVNDMIDSKNDYDDIYNLSDDFEHNLLLEEHDIPKKDDYIKIQENKFLKIIRLIFMNIVSDKCIYKDNDLTILLNDLIEKIQEPFNDENCIDFSKLKNIILSDFQLN